VTLLRDRADHPAIRAAVFLVVVFTNRFNRSASAFALGDSEGIAA
jgi:hypothetical protein